MNALAACLCFTTPLLAHVGLDTPPPGTAVEPGQTVTITWTDLILHDGVGYDLDLLPTLDAVDVVPIVHDLPVSTHRFDWVVPDLACAGCYLRVTQVNGERHDYTDAIGITLLGSQPIAGDPPSAAGAPKTARAAPTATASRAPTARPMAIILGNRLAALRVAAPGRATPIPRRAKRAPLACPQSTRELRQLTVARPRAQAVTIRTLARRRKMALRSRRPPQALPANRRAKAFSRPQPPRAVVDFRLRGALLQWSTSWGSSRSSRWAERDAER